MARSGLEPGTPRFQSWTEIGLTRTKVPQLTEHGVAGLLRALDRYDPTLNTPFWAYATWWVRQAMR
jgi:DNA-directed RNA polymerase specialized sigma subunit